VRPATRPVPGSGGLRLFSSRSSELTRKPAPSSPALVDPDIDARRLPVVGLVQDVEIAVAVKVGDPGFVKIDSLGEYAGPKVSLAIAVKNPGRGVGVVGLCLLFPPLGHLGGEDVKISIPVDVSKLKAVPVDHRPLAQIPACPGLWIGGSSGARAVGPHEGRFGRPAMGRGQLVKTAIKPASRAEWKIKGTFIMMSMNRLSGPMNERRYLPLGLKRRASVRPAVIRT